MKRTFDYILFFIATLLAACNQPNELIHQELLLAGKAKQANDTLITDSIEHLIFSRLNKPGSAGMQYFYELPENHQNKHLYLVFEGRIRSNYAQSNASIVVMAFDKHKSQLCWLVCPLRPHVVKQNEWNHFCDSIHVANVINDIRYVSLSAFPYLGTSGKEKFDMDTFSVKLKQREEY